MNRLPETRPSNLLAVETSSEACSLALLWHGEVHSRHEAAPMLHAERLLPWVRELLEEAGASVAIMPRTDSDDTRQIGAA